MNKQLELFLTFAKIGGFTFGGGYAMIPLIQREVAENKKWITDKDLLDVIAIAESTPGPIAINAATFIGNRVAGVTGAVCATLGVVMPSFLVIVAISYAFEAFKHLKAVEYAFWGIRAGVTALILKALWTMFKQCKKDWLSLCLMALAFAAVVFLKINAIFVILACAAIGIVSFQIRRVRK
ncbi:MAG: chromate transporter [Lachnospiraceae bacterium]|nr:chromate transporter [Lachnospiraceae bacterium]